MSLFKINLGPDISIEIGTELVQGIGNLGNRMVENIESGKNPFDFLDDEGRLNLKFFLPK